MVWGYVICGILSLIIGTLLGIRLHANHIASHIDDGGTLIVLHDSDDGKYYIALDLDISPEEISKLEYVVFSVRKETK